MILIPFKMEVVLATKDWIQWCLGPRKRGVQPAPMRGKYFGAISPCQTEHRGASRCGLRPHLSASWQHSKPQKLLCLKSSGLCKLNLLQQTKQKSKKKNDYLQLWFFHVLPRPWRCKLKPFVCAGFLCIHPGPSLRREVIFWNTPKETHRKHEWAQKLSEKTNDIRLFCLFCPSLFWETFLNNLKATAVKALVVEVDDILGSVGVLNVTEALPIQG